MVAVPKPLPRVAVAADGSFAMVGQYRMDPNANILAQFPNSLTSLNIGGNAIDSKAGIIYAQIPTVSATTSTGSSSSTPAAPTSAAGPVHSGCRKPAGQGELLDSRKYYRPQHFERCQRHSLYRLR